MKTYDAVVLYRTPGRRCLKRPIGGVVAKDTREARRKALMLFEGGRGKNAVDVSVIGVTLEEQPSVYVKPKPAPVPAPIQNGEQITVPITGTVELEKNGDVTLRGSNGYRLRLRRQDVERKTNRTVAPPPPVVTVEYYSLYPNQYCYGAARPIQSSQHGLDQLVQVRVTRHDGKIVAKEIV